MRAWEYERRLEEGRGGELARRCWDEVKGRARKGRVMGGWEKERREFYEGRGWKVEEVEDMREGGCLRGEFLVEKEKSLQREERWKRIRETEYNKWYEKVKGMGVPGYLKRGWEEDRWQRVARYRLGNGMRGERYWMKEEDRKCRLCGWGEETWEHV